MNPSSSTPLPRRSLGEGGSPLYLGRSIFRAGHLFCAVFLLLAFSLGFLADRWLFRRSAISNPQSALIEPPRYVASDNAISRFGMAPVNPDWLQVSHRSGQPIDGVPSPEWAVFTFFYEPKVEKVEQPNGVTTWKVTFQP